MDAFPDLKHLMDRLTELIQNISDGEIPFILSDALEEYERQPARPVR